jgi:hypothetical protein
MAFLLCRVRDDRERTTQISCRDTGAVLKSGYMKLLAVLRSLGVVAALIATSAQADDLVSPPIFATTPFYFGVFGGVSMSRTVNTLVEGDAIVGEHPTAGETTGALAGLVAGYGTITGPIYWGIEISVAYDFGNQCFNMDCVIERHNGWLFQQVVELGFPAWNTTIFASRIGLAERTKNLCAFNASTTDDQGLFTGVRVCDSGFVAAPSVGGKIKFLAAPHADISAVWDHVFWGSDYSVSPVSPISFQNSAGIKNEDVFKFVVTFH